MEKVKQRLSFDVYKCRNKRCPYRTNPKLRKVAIANGANPRAISYIHRDCHINLDILQTHQTSIGKIDFALCRSTYNLVILAVVFHIHIGLSLRESAFWIHQLYGVKISHQTISNWCVSLAKLLTPMINQIISDAKIAVCDETYIRVAGRNAYWIVSMDPISRTIIFSDVYEKRDTQAMAMQITISNQLAPNMNVLVTDAYKAYDTAFALIQSQIKHVTVKGLSYRGVWQDLFLPCKQTIERFFRTFKQRYRRTHGFGSISGSRAFCILFGVFYSFFRPHCALDGHSPLTNFSTKSDARFSIKFSEELVLCKWHSIIDYACSL
jgi:transposase-like protein